MYSAARDCAVGVQRSRSLHDAARGEFDFRLARTHQGPCEFVPQVSEANR
jgi:hypothetical protein